MDHPLHPNSSSSSSSSASSSSSSSSSSASLSVSSSSSSSASSSPSPSSTSIADRILAPLGFALLVLLVAIISYSFARRRRRVGVHSPHGASLPADDDDDEDDSARGGGADEIDAGLSEAAILSYPKLLYSNAKLRRGKPSESCCSICLTDYGDGDVLRLLPECDHYFHLKCVDPWLKLHSSCPICRKSLTSS